ncbi:MAG: hypothetical protein PHC53_05995, partial [Patescibacteria group bacterium]|nr:hypothetical protein [Patescibacteria group bacterium]
MGTLTFEQAAAGLPAVPERFYNAFSKQARKILEGPLADLPVDIHFAVQGHLRDSVLQPYVDVKLEHRLTPPKKALTEMMPYGMPFSVKTVVRMTFFTRLNPSSHQPDIMSTFCDEDGCNYPRFADWD